MIRCIFAFSTFILTARKTRPLRAGIESADAFAVLAVPWGTRETVFAKERNGNQVLAR
jgi:hypothetical protein